MKPSSTPIKKLLHDDKIAYDREGQGGKPVWQWPIYNFFKLYYNDGKAEAEKHFADWYKEQYTKYSITDKSKGGMKNGSLDKLIKSAKFSGDKGFEQAVVSRVRQRFSLLESIRDKGYLPNPNTPVMAIKRRNQYVLFAGHHKVAVLAVLGYTHVPDVVVFRSWLHYKFFRLGKKLSDVFRSTIKGL